MPMIDFTIPSTAKAAHPLILKIEIQHNSLQKLVSTNHGFFQNMRKELELWKATKIDESNCVSEEEIIQREYNWEKESIYNLENDFYHAAFILVYSYFESIIAAMCKNKSLTIKPHVVDNVKEILNCCKESFSANVQSKYDYVVGDLKSIRNLLTHNYNGTDKDNQIKAADRESAKDIGFQKISDESFVVKLPYIEQALDNVYEILKELSSMLNLKS